MHKLWRNGILKHKMNIFQVKKWHELIFLENKCLVSRNEDERDNILKKLQKSYKVGENIKTSVVQAQ